MVFNTTPATPKPDRGKITLKARSELTDYVTAWASVHKLTQAEVFYLLSEALYGDGKRAVSVERRKKSLEHVMEVGDGN